MKATALIERGKDGTFGVFTSDINSVIIGDGTTVEEAKADFENSVREILAFYKEDGLELPDELKDVEFVYKYDMASMFDYHHCPNVTKFAKRARINPSLMRHTVLSEQQIDA